MQQVHTLVSNYHAVTEAQCSAAPIFHKTYTLCDVLKHHCATQQHSATQKHSATQQHSASQKHSGTQQHSGMIKNV